MMIRDEQPGEEARIHELTKQAFAPVEMSDGSEPMIVDRLRADGDLTLSLVALDGERIVGHAAFSPVTLSGANGAWYGLGPISVHPDCQRSGIGRQLIETGLDRLRARNAAGCVLLGDPAYYARFGFTAPGDLTLGDIPTEYVQALGFGDIPAKGEIRYAPGFGLE